MTLDFLKHPLVVLVSLVVAVVSVGLTVYFYLDSREFREPVYLVDEEHKQIFDSTASSPKIKVLDKDSNPVTDNIFLATVTIWNAGKLSIEPEDVRVPLRIHIKPKSKLLDYSIVKESDPEITKFQLSESLGLSWLHFDPGYGVKVQLLYSSREQAGIELTGKIKGAAKLKKFESTRRLNPNIIYVPFFLLVFVVGVSVGGFDSKITKKIPERNKRFRPILSFLIVIIFIIMIIISYRFLNLLNTINPPL